MPLARASLLSFALVLGACGAARALGEAAAPAPAEQNTPSPGANSSEDKPARDWITTVRDLRSLDYEAAADSLQVRIKGVVTYLEPQRGLAFVQDETGGTYFSIGNFEGRPEDRKVPYKVGDLIEIEGTSSPGSFAPFVTTPPGKNAPKIEILGRGSTPRPARLDPGRLLDPSRDGSWVETVGVVRSVNPFPGRLVIDVTNGLEDFTVIVSGGWPSARIPNEFVGSSVLIRGVFGAISDSNRQFTGLRIFSPALWHITPLDKDVDKAFASDPLRVDQLLQYRASTARVRVRGVVTAAFPGRQLFLRIGDAALVVVSNDRELPEPGREVDVVGFPVLAGGSVTLHTPVFRPGELGPAPVPVDVSPSDLIQRRWHGELVRTEARLLNRFVSGRECLFLFSDGSRTFSARLSIPPGAEPPDLPVESWVTLSGLALIEQDPGPPNAEARPQVRPPVDRGFSLLLRTPADLALLRTPPFWTVDRILVAVAAAGGLLVLALFWVGLLRRKINQQTALIAQKVEREQVVAERARIARELHDTVEQELAGIGLQLDLARTRVNQAPERALPAIELALRMLRRTQNETRNSIHDLRSGLLERADLAAAIKESVDRLRIEQNAPIEAEIHTPLQRLSAVTEHNLLRIAQEALANACEHARASRITIRLSNQADGLHLEITDNGAGFNLMQSHPGHFGLQGMRERARKIGATFTQHSRPGDGTRIHVLLPQPATQ